VTTICSASSVPSSKNIVALLLYSKNTDTPFIVMLFMHVSCESDRKKRTLDIFNLLVRSIIFYLRLRRSRISLTEQIADNVAPSFA